MARSEENIYQSRAIMLLSGLAVIAALYLSREILLPFALAVLLSFLLAPFVARLERWKFPRVAAVLVVVTLCFAALAILSSTVVRQLYDFANRLPDYKGNLIHKTEAFRGEGDSIVKKLTDAFTDVFEQVSPIKNQKRPEILKPAGEISRRPQTVATPRPDAGRNERVDQLRLAEGKKDADPIRVEIVNRHSISEIIPNLLEQVLGPIGIAVIVIVLVIFMLLEREDLRNRLIYLIGSRQINQTTQALDDAAHRLSRYLLMQFAINTAFGLIVAATLFVIGMPNALLWGVMAAVLRFVPYVGAPIAGIIIMVLSLAVFNGWTEPILVVSLFTIYEFVTGNFVEPWLYGASTGISKIGILISAVFWTWLWGPVGLIIATPLTVCMTVIAKYVPQMSFLNKLLSTQEMLPPHQHFYQRLLALDPEEALDVVEEFLKENSLEALYDRVLVPALGLAEQDRHEGDLDEARQRLIMDTVREVIDDRGATAKLAVSEEHAAIPDVNAPAPKIVSRRNAVLCLPARGEADEIIALMLAQLLEARGLSAITPSTKTMVSEMMAQVTEQGVGVVCVSALPPFAATHARYLCKRLRPKFPNLNIVVGLWQGGTKKAQERLAATGVDAFVATLAEATELVARLAAESQLKT